MQSLNLHVAVPAQAALLPFPLLKPGLPIPCGCAFSAPSRHRIPSLLGILTHSQSLLWDLTHGQLQYQLSFLTLSLQRNLLKTPVKIFFTFK